LAQLLVLFGIFATYSQYGFAQFQKSAGAGIQEAIKASASDQA